MNRRQIFAITIACFAGPTLALAQAGGWVTLLDGKSLDNWTRTGDANWRIEDGAAVADKGNGHLVSKESYTDFEIRAEFWVNEDANSGIFIRNTDAKKPSSKTGYEVNIYDNRPGQDYGTGAIVDVAKVSPAQKAGGKWNVMEIVAKGPSMTVTLNGVKTVDGAKDARNPSGPVSIQYGTGIVKFRKFEIRRL
jgi:hypothetical protein